MAEAFDATKVVKETAPDGVEGQLIGIHWTGNRKVSWIELFFDFLVGETKIGEGRLEISPGTLSDAIEKTYTALEAAATIAGLEPGDEDWPQRPDVNTIFAAAQAMVGNGTGLTPAAAAGLVFKKNYGQWMLRREWAKSAVKKE